MNPGAIVRMTSYKHVCPNGTQFGFSTKDRKYVTVFVLLGHEHKDGSKSLDIEQALNELGWIPKPAVTISDPQLTPKAFVDSILSACDASNWDADRNKGDYYCGLRDAYKAVHEIANEYQTAMYQWTRSVTPVTKQDARLQDEMAEGEASQQGKEGG